jgi:transcriptional regulator with XRE-family HTH domain
MSPPPPLDRASLVATAADRLGLNQRELADTTGVSLRTVSRWFSNRSTPQPMHLEALARTAAGKDDGLASALARAAGTTPEAVGVQSASGDAGTDAGPLPDALRVECIVCAAASAMDTSPNLVRPALLAAFTRARDVGMGVEAVLSLLAAQAPAAKTKTPAAKAKRTA